MTSATQTKPARYQLSAKTLECLEAKSGGVGRTYFVQSPIIDHTPPDSFSEFVWFVVVCNPKCERRAQLGLRRKGYATYLPMMKKDVTHARKVQAVERPLFPRYLFIGLKDYGLKGGQDFYGLRNVDGVEAIVRNSMIPVRVSGEGLARLRAREVGGEFDCSDKEKRSRMARIAQCKPGSRVEITAGPMAGLSAIVKHVQDTGHIQTLIEFLGRATPVKIRIEDVQLAKVPG